MNHILHLHSDMFTECPKKKSMMARINSKASFENFGRLWIWYTEILAIWEQRKSSLKSLGQILKNTKNDNFSNFFLIHLNFDIFWVNIELEYQPTLTKFLKFYLLTSNSIFVAPKWPKCVYQMQNFRMCFKCSIRVFKWGSISVH